eukprot:13808998-Alexandrium_andersonii.AAC.1
MSGKPRAIQAACMCAHLRPVSNSGATLLLADVISVLHLREWVSAVSKQHLISISGNAEQ